jgi:hypothetical protein
MAACRSSSKNTGKNHLLSNLNKYSPRAHTKSELDMLGIARKLVKYVVHCPKKLLKKILLFFSQAAQTEND